MRVEKSWGFEEIIENGDFCCKKLVYTKPIASSLHYHEKKREVFVVATGKFWIEWDTNVSTFLPGDYVVLPPGTHHRIRCVEPGFLVESSTPDDPKDCVRLVPSES
jgi:mannose-6-phosphate isomerase-like protein (cupin superfamily)